MSISAYGGTINQSASEFRSKITSYGASTDFFGAIFNGCGFEKFRKDKILLVDAMAGPGKLGKDIRAKCIAEKLTSPIVSVFFNDVRAEPLALLKKENERTMRCDIREIGEAGYRIDILAVRYGLKDLPKDQLPIALSAAYNSLLSGGRLVIGDMMAYTPEGQEGAITVHAAKQEFAGRNRDKEGACFIPTADEWMVLLSDAGFSNIKLSLGYTSEVETSQWKGQFGQNKDDLQIIQELNSVIRKTASSNPIFKDEFEVTFIGEKTYVNFPIMVACAEKTPK